MPRILGATLSRPAQRRAIPPLWDGRARPRGAGNYLRERIAFGDIAPGSLPCPSNGGYCPPFNARVEEWREDISALAGTLPIDFLLAWIQIESMGSACSYTSLAESGIFQLMKPDNLMAGQTTEAEQHPVPPCAAGTSSYVWRGQLTDEQAKWQVQGGINFVNYCKSVAESKLGTMGYLGQPGWTDTDWSYWAMVKMVHVAPAPIIGMLTRGLSGGGIPADWDAMIANGGGTGVPSNWIANARAVGIFGAGGGSIVNGVLTAARDPFALLAVGGLVALYLLTRK